MFLDAMYEGWPNRCIPWYASCGCPPKFLLGYIPGHFKRVVPHGTAFLIV